MLESARGRERDRFELAGVEPPPGALDGCLGIEPRTAVEVAALRAFERSHRDVAAGPARRTDRAREHLLSVSGRDEELDVRAAAVPRGELRADPDEIDKARNDNAAPGGHRADCGVAVDRAVVDGRDEDGLRPRAYLPVGAAVVDLGLGRAGAAEDRAVGPQEVEMRVACTGREREVARCPLLQGCSDAGVCGKLRDRALQGPDPRGEIVCSRRPGGREGAERSAPRVAPTLDDDVGCGRGCG